MRALFHPRRPFVVVENNQALGSTADAVVVNNGAQLQLTNVTGAIQQNLILNGNGVANSGAVLNAAGANTWAGNVALDSATLNSSGVATLSTSSLAFGSQTLSAVYSGSTFDSGSTSNKVKRAVHLQVGQLHAAGLLGRPAGHGQPQFHHAHWLAALAEMGTGPAL